MVAFVPLDSRHPSRPACGGDDWGAENDGGRGQHCPADPHWSLPTRQHQSRRGSTHPVILAALVPAEGGDWGGGNPVALASSTFCRFTSARLAPVPVRIKEGGDAPSRRQDQSHSPRRRRADWGVGNPVALASSTYCRFTSARLTPNPARIKAGGDPVKKSIAFSL